MIIWFVAGLSGLLALHVLFAFRRSWRRGVSARRRERPFSADPVANDAYSVSILVPAWNEAGTIEHCLRSLEAITYNTAEVIVIAGGVDDTYDIADSWCFERFPYSVLPQPSGGKNAALGHGLQSASGEVIVVLDADSVVKQDWLNELLAPLTRGADAVCGDYSPRRLTWISAFEQMEKMAANDITEPSALQGSGSIAIFRTALDEAGGFPGAVKVGVDWDLGMRLQTSGHSLAFARDAQLETDRAGTLAEFWRNEVRWRRAHLASIWSRRHWYARRPLEALKASAFLVMTLVTLSVLLLPVGLWPVSPTAGVLSTLVSLMFLAWIAARRVSLVLLVAAYSGDRSWLRQWWVPSLLLFVSMLATIFGGITMSLLSAQFKGPRSAELAPSET